MKAQFASLLLKSGAAMVGLAIGSSLLVVSASLAQENAPAYHSKKPIYAALAEAPKKAREKNNPYAGDAEAVAAGGKLFERYCAECHGTMAEGSRKAPTLVHEEVREASGGMLFWILTNGVVRQGMPVWSKLPEQQRWQLVTFLQSLNAPASGTAGAKPDSH